MLCGLGVAGVRGGPEVGTREFLRDRLPPFGVTAKTLVFKAGAISRAVAAGTQLADVDLYVFDASGNLVAWDDSPQDAAAVEWLPQQMARFSVVVRNSTASDDVVDLFIR